MSRKQRRRAERAAARMGLPLKQFEAWTKSELPEDYPNPGGEPLSSDLQVGLRMIRTVERSETLQHIEPKMTLRRGPKGVATPKALLVCIQLAAHLSTKSYKRSDVTAALVGLHPVVAEMLGLLDKNGNRRPAPYKALCKMIKKLERKLTWGWNFGDVRCDKEWFNQQMITATVPRKIRRSVTAVAVDSTPVPGWARTLHYTKQSDLEKDAYAHHRKAVLDSPDRPEPELKRRELVAEAKKKGLRVGKDGRIIRGKTPTCASGGPQEPPRPQGISSSATSSKRLRREPRRFHSMTRRLRGHLRWRVLLSGLTASPRGPPRSGRPHRSRMGEDSSPVHSAAVTFL